MENILELQQVSKTFPRSDFALVWCCLRICRGKRSGKDDDDRLYIEYREQRQRHRETVWQGDVGRGYGHAGEDRCRL